MQLSILLTVLEVERLGIWLTLVECPSVAQ